MIKKNGLNFNRVLSKSEIHPYEEIKWVKRDALITAGDGSIVFKQENVEAPDFWSDSSVNIVVSRYFRGQLGTPTRETSIKDLINRVVDTIVYWGVCGNYFTQEVSNTFSDELKYIMVNQLACFNTPTLLNLGWSGRKQSTSACYLNSLEDSMESILQLHVTEGLLFKSGAGSGTNLSTLRSSKESLTAGGHSSGVVSFMRALDSNAGAIKSGGSARRAACMRILNVDHGDILEFVETKVVGEKVAQALIDSGFDKQFNSEGGAYTWAPYQNANHSVRVTDEFMNAVEEDLSWETKAVTDGRTLETMKARDLMRSIALAAWKSGDPGIQYDSKINEWHTTPNNGRINTSNPCSEVMYHDDVSCNLASINLMKFNHDFYGFNVDKFKHVIGVMITAMEICVGFSDYPTQKITDVSHKSRPLGLGYCALGELLMSKGLPYDSAPARDLAAVMTALMTGTAYTQSAKIAAAVGAFEWYEENKKEMLGVIEKHRKAVLTLRDSGLRSAAQSAWDEAYLLGYSFGYRNGQVVVMAPTGTISFYMGAGTTGVEPEICLLKTKSLAAGGVIKNVSSVLRETLKCLRYTDTEINNIISYIEKKGTVEGDSGLLPEHLSVFDCALKAENGTRFLSPMAHVKMVAAIQPFLSGGCSKSCNVPFDSTVEDIEEIYMQAWKLGLKSISVYRDGSKKSQPLNAGNNDEKDIVELEDVPVDRLVAAFKKESDILRTLPYDESIIHNSVSHRKRLPDERKAITHRFEISGHECYLTVGLYENGMPGELFIIMSKEGSTISGLMDSFATAVSIALQYRVPLKVLIDKFVHTRYEPSGFTKSKEIPIAKSLTDYIFRWLSLKFMPKEDQDAVGIIDLDTYKFNEQVLGLKSKLLPAYKNDSSSCRDCGSIMIRNGNCYSCSSCGATTGCG